MPNACVGRFTATFPSQPTVTATTYKSQYDADLRARVYRSELGASRYTLTVVDYSQIEQILAPLERSHRRTLCLGPCDLSLCPVGVFGQHRHEGRGAPTPVCAQKHWRRSVNVN